LRQLDRPVIGDMPGYTGKYGVQFFPGQANQNPGQLKNASARKTLRCRTTFKSEIRRDFGIRIDVF
jgi:hypothetical protein